jgi:hypothetical protein
VAKAGITKGSYWNAMIFQSNVGQGLSPSPLIDPVMLFRTWLVGEIHEIQLKYDIAGKRKTGIQKYRNMAVKATVKSFILDQVYVFRKGPSTGTLPSEWKARFKAIVTRDVGQTV